MLLMPFIWPLLREVSEGLNRGEPSTASTSPRSVASDYSRSKSSPPRLTLHGDGDGELFGMHHDSPDPIMAASLRRTPSRDDSDNASDHSVEDFGHEGAAEGGPSVVVQLLQDVEEDPPTPSHNGSVCCKHFKRRFFISEQHLTIIGPCIFKFSCATVL